MNNQDGFSLVELLVSVAIIGLIAAIAIPEFKEYKKRAYDSVALSDLRNAITAQESYYIDNETYFVGSSNLSSFSFTPSNGVVIFAGLSPNVGPGDPDKVYMAAYHDKGKYVYCYEAGEQAHSDFPVISKSDQGIPSFGGLGDCA